MSEKLYVCDHTASCDNKSCVHRYIHEHTGDDCKSGHCNSLDRRVECVEFHKEKLYVCSHAEAGDCEGCKHRFLHEHKGADCGPMHCPWANGGFGTDVKCEEFDDKRLKEAGQSLGVVDPNGVCLGDPGCKLDGGKVEPSFALDGFPRALEAVARVGMFGAYTKGYGVNAWQSVENGVKRYREARFRHDMAIARGEEIDPESGLPHAFHSLWNHLAELELTLRK